MNDLHQAMLDAEQREREADQETAARRAIFYVAADYFRFHPYTDEKYAAMLETNAAWHTARDISDKRHAETVAARDAWLRTVKPVPEEV